MYRFTSIQPSISVFQLFKRYLHRKSTTYTKNQVIRFYLHIVYIFIYTFSPKNSTHPHFTIHLLGSHSTADKDQANWTWWQGHVHGRRRARLPSHHITSPETIKFVKEAGERLQKKETNKRREESFFVKGHATESKEG